MSLFDFMRHPPHQVPHEPPSLPWWSKQAGILVSSGSGDHPLSDLSNPYSNPKTEISNAAREAFYLKKVSNELAHSSKIESVKSYAIALKRSADIVEKDLRVLSCRLGNQVADKHPFLPVVSSFNQISLVCSSIQCYRYKSLVEFI